MTEDEHYLTCLAEEAVEVAQRVTKALRFGLTEVQAGQGRSNRMRVADEMRDLVGVYAICKDRGLLPGYGVDVFAKRAKIERYMDIARKEGVLS